jgi:hypothetical protein
VNGQLAFIALVAYDACVPSIDRYACRRSRVQPARGRPTRIYLGSGTLVRRQRLRLSSLVATPGRAVAISLAATEEECFAGPIPRRGCIRMDDGSRFGLTERALLTSIVTKSLTRLGSADRERQMTPVFWMRRCLDRHSEAHASLCTEFSIRDATAHAATVDRRAHRRSLGGWCIRGP